MKNSSLVRHVSAALLLTSLAATAAQMVVPPAATIALPAGTLDLACADLSLQGGAMSVGASEVMLAGNVTIAVGATLDGGAGMIGVGGNWSNAGTFTAGTGTVSFEDGCTTLPATITGTTTFTNLTLTTTNGRVFVIPAGRLVTVSGQLLLLGSPVQVVSSDPTQPTSIVMGPGGRITDTSSQLGVNVTLDATAFPRLFAISTRAGVLTNDNVMIAGFIIGGTTPKTVVVRARGPSTGVAGLLANPTLTLVPANGSAATFNDDWGSAANSPQLAATGFAPGDSREAAVMATLAPGAYTAIASGLGNTTGVAIVEVYELDRAESPMSAISTRALVRAGDNVVIGGFIIQGGAPQTVVVRARGPSLGIPGALLDPVLTLVPADGSPGIVNDDWQTAANSAQLSTSGFAPGDPRESAILATLQPGGYTAIVSGAGGTEGIAIVEVYAQ